VSDASLSDASVDELVALSLELDDESHEYWAPIRELHERGDQATFERARSLVIDGPDERERILGVHILAQLGSWQGRPRPFVDEILPVLEGVAGRDQSPRMIDAVVIALGHLSDKRSLSAVLAHVDHSDEEVRYAVAYALPTVSEDPPPPAVVGALFALMEDADDEVRNWATFGLGSMFEVDTPEVRDALFARIDDEGDDGTVAGEALVGLARRRDPRALEPIIHRLETRNPEPGGLILDAAAELADRRCLPALYALRDIEDEDDNPWWTAALARAIEACEGAV
jgi:hypothetical protein